jgi:ferredoxin
MTQAMRRPFRIYLPFPRHTRTAHVSVDPHRCEGCGRCVEACTRGALGLLPIPGHRHVHVDAADRCKGCLRCVSACPRSAIRALHPPASSSARPPRAA